MKKYFILSLFVLFIFSCSDETQTKKEETKDNGTGITSIEFPEESHDFGQIIQGERVEHTFIVKNTGDKNLIMKSVTATCGCTVPDYDKAPIAPGETGKIKVTFDSNNREGQQNKTITVIANTEPDSHKLVITGNVVKP